MKFLLIQTGGTIDKDYATLVKAYNFEITEPAARRIFANVAPLFSYDILPLLQKDSMDLTDEDRQKIYDACNNAQVDKILITHGTDTMVQTAQKLSTLTKKTIVLTGSSRPERFSNSDAAFNVGVAIGALNLLTPGVYIAMNGIVYPYNNVQKHQETGRFVPVAA